MNYRINQQERDALKGLPHLSRLTYFEALRPYMDFRTGIIGIKRGISYRSLTEELYVEPHVGYESGSPSKPQMRRVIQTLARAGLVSVESLGKKLILKCLLATQDNCVQNKVVTKPTQEGDTKPAQQNNFKINSYEENCKKAGALKIAQAGTPPESGNSNIIFLQSAFEEFWNLYPLQRSKQKAFAAFHQLSPSPILFQAMMQALKTQIDAHANASAQGVWMPNWKYPANWILERCWEEIPLALPTQGKRYAKSEDVLWESCRDSFAEERNDNVVDIRCFK